MRSRLCYSAGLITRLSVTVHVETRVSAVITLSSELDSVGPGPGAGTQSRTPPGRDRLSPRPGPPQPAAAAAALLTVTVLY